MFSPGIIGPDRVSDSDLWFVFRANALLVISDGIDARVPSRLELLQLGLVLPQHHYLGQLGEQHCFTAELPADAPAVASIEWQNLRGLFGRIDETSFALAGRAIQILLWDSTHRYCGRCGSATELHASERSRVCPGCGLIHYPRLSPAVMALIRRGNELLLARSPR